jgi:uncharacterized membrane protein YozB (DUF420 family)
MELPTFNACMNTGSAVCLVLAFVAMRRERYKQHGLLMGAALLFSAVFLTGYVYYHFFSGVPEKRYAGPEAWKLPYLIMLATHVVLAAINLPLILWTFWLGKQGTRERHERWARWAYPIWLYVSVTGVLVYLVLYVWFPGELPDATPPG